MRRPPSRGSSIVYRKERTWGTPLLGGVTPSGTEPWSPMALPSVILFVADSAFGVKSCDKVEGLRRGAHEGLLSGAMMAPFCASRERLREARWGCCPAEMRFAGAGGVLKHLRAGGRPATGNCKRTLCRHQRERAVASLDRAIADPQIKWRRVLPTYERRSARRR